MKVLITGFEPFGKHTINPSLELTNTLPGIIDEDIKLNKMILPVDHECAPKVLLDHLRHWDPDIVLCFGLAPERSKICLERVAINLMDFQIPDNAGVKVSETPIIIDGPAAYFSNLPIQDLLSKLLDDNIPARISLTAGSYLCNQIFYTLMHEIESYQLPIKAGFIHLPPLPQDRSCSGSHSHSLDMAAVTSAVMLIIRTLYNSHINT